MDHTNHMTKRQQLHIRLSRKAYKICGGSQARLAELMGGNTRQGHVTQWMNGKKLVSPHSAVMMETAVSCGVRREQFYPELYKSMARLEPKKDAA